MRCHDETTGVTMKQLVCCEAQWSTDAASIKRKTNKYLSS